MLIAPPFCLPVSPLGPSSPPCSPPSSPPCGLPSCLRLAPRCMPEIVLCSLPTGGVWRPFAKRSAQQFVEQSATQCFSPNSLPAVYKVALHRPATHQVTCAQVCPSRDKLSALQSTQQSCQRSGQLPARRSAQLPARWFSGLGG